MKITQIETFTRDQLCIVRVQTETGAEGFGQTAPFHADITATVLHRQVAPHALGCDPEDIDGVIDHCVEREYKFPGSYVRRGVGGLDTALWDLRGRLAGRSVCQLLGQQRASVPAYGSSMRRDITPQDEAARLAQLRDEHGFGAFKIRIGKVCGHDEDQWPGRTDALVPTVRRAIGDDVSLLVDANSCYTASKAIEVGRMLEDNAVCHFEEPCPYWEYEWTAEVADALSIPVAGGEQDCFLHQWRRMIAMRAVDIVQPDVCYVGGLTRALRVARMAADTSLPCVPHSANLSMVTVFTVHMLGAIENAGPYLEYCIEDSRWTDDLLCEPLAFRDGCVMVPDGHGWGVTVNPKWLADADHQVSRMA